MNRGPATRHLRLPARPGWGLPALLIFLFSLGQVQALEIQPVLAEVSPSESTATFSLRNGGIAPLRLQVDALDWRQDGEAESTSPSVELIVVPRIANLEPGATQRVRVALRQGDRNRERSYRLLLREIPPPPEPGFMGLRTRLEVSVPVFFRASNAAPPVPGFRALRAEDGSLSIAFSNSGERYARLSTLRLTQPDGAVLGEASGVFYALAGAGRLVNLRTHSLPVAGTALRLLVADGAQEQSFDLRLE